MYRISQLAELVGLSRTTLLYYEKLGLIKGERLNNGYRQYSEKDAQRLVLLQNLQAGGLTLKECQACLDAKVNREVLVERLEQLDQEIEQKQNSRQLLAALLGESSLTDWHESLDQLAPEAHIEWLMKQGFDEKQAMRLKWLSKDMNEHERYMQDFDLIFKELERWGPGSESDTLKALQKVPNKPMTLLEIGCGQGIATELFARHSDAMIIAVDNEEFALKHLMEKMQQNGLEDKITTVCADMAKMPFETKSFDLIWSEGSAYIMGVQNALKAWKPLLSEDGVLVVSDLVWSTDKPSESALSFWKKEYPDMVSVSDRIKHAQQAGYEVIEHFSLSDAAWEAYYHPLIKRLDTLKDKLIDSPVLIDFKNEITAFKQRKNEFDYEIFILRSR
ncbi:MerR family transcriptional regulator [Aliivibrio sp. S10_S31]|uniref:MerR family transcriptional regulator n=1 Tax=Aliivibrio sp. S10_S31 TaxID=2720224 RepID=UPI001680A73A|nr:MerR family transcriptional regulator [Aliivibrio sp. S10_S31]MBD1570313.1 MerR family transcriptional regulator [Aliivibrio sp. S10_S31]